MLDKRNTTMIDDARKRIAVLDSEGHSASVISKALWNEFGIYKTRNAVIGLIHRMGLRKTRGQRATKWTLNRKDEIVPCSIKAPAPVERKQSRHSNRVEGGRAFRPAPVKAPVAIQIEAAPEVVEGGPVPLVDLREHHCRAIVGRGADGLATFCGVSNTRGAYCDEHARMFYVPVKDRGEAVADFLAGGRWVDCRGNGDQRRTVDRHFAQNGTFCGWGAS